MKLTKPIVFKVSITGDWAYGAIFPSHGNGFAITMTTSFGNFGYIWSHPGEDILHFLKTLDMDYAMTKLVDSHETYQFDHEATHKAATAWVKENFADDSDRLKRAEEEIEEFFGDVEFRNEDEYLRSAWSGLQPFPFRESEEIPLEKIFIPQLKGFWDKMWRPIIAEIEKGLENA